MNSLRIGNINNPPLNNINGKYVNIDNSHSGNNTFTNTLPPPQKINTLPQPLSNIQSANSQYPTIGGNKIKRKNISHKYMTHSNYCKHKHKRNYTSYFNRRNRTYKYHNKYHNKYKTKHRFKRRHYYGGTPFMSRLPLSTPQYSTGHSQMGNNNGSLSNTFSLANSKLSPNLSAMANPPTFQKLQGEPDNLNHYTYNSYGNSGAGSGFASRGWF